MKRKLTSLIAVILVLSVFLSACGSEKKSAGEKSFTLTVVDLDGNETKHEIKTDKATVGEALLAEGIIKGEDGPYGLYIKEVDGITADYDTDGTYWAFYINGEYAMTGVDTTDIEDGAEYMLKVEK